MALQQIEITGVNLYVHLQPIIRCRDQIGQTSTLQGVAGMEEGQPTGAWLLLAGGREV